MTITDFKRVENLFTMFRNVDELTAERLAKSIKRDNNPVIKDFLRIFLDASGGIKNTAALLNYIRRFTTGDAAAENQKIFNTLFEFYSNVQDGVLPFSTGSYMCFGQPEPIKTGAEINQKLYFLNSDLEHKTITTILSHAPYLSLCNRDVNAVETFLNFLPSTVISRCVPYCDIEFVFDRPKDRNAEDNSTAEGKLLGPTLLRFLNDDKGRTELSAVDQAMVAAREFSFKSEAAYDADTSNRVLTSSGMEMFLSPQTLVNMDPRANDGRYFPVLDRTRPLMSLESVTINSVPTTGLLNHKTATMALKVHDKSRLTEVAELLEPYGTNRVSLWMTYGWRHPVESTPESNIAQTYGQFINEKMILKECYGLKNATYSFDTTGQCTITCELFTKSVDQLLGITLAEEKGFEVLRKRKRELVTSINEIMKKLNLHNLKLESKEVRSFQILSAAAGGRQPTVEAKEISGLITKLTGLLNEKLKKVDKKRKPDKSQGSFNEKDVQALENALKEYYDEATGVTTSTNPESLSVVTEAFISKKMNDLKVGHDPFLQYEDKFIKRGSETTTEQKPEYWDDLKPYLEKKEKSVVSFGKLFLTLMAPALDVAETIDESQIFFYTLNEYAGKASGMNIAYFPIEISEFEAKFREFITRKASAALTAHEIVTLAVDSQFKNLSAIPYGFKDMSETLFEGKGGDAKVKDSEKFEIRSLDLNKNRGAFKIPKITLYIEMLNVQNGNVTSFDKLSLFEQSATSLNRPGVQNRIARLHILDEVSNPNAPILTAVRKEIADYKPNDPNNVDVNSYVSNQANQAKIEEAIRLETGKDNARNYVFRASTIYKETTSTYEAEIKDRETLRRALAYEIPTLIPGMNASGIIEVSLASKADPLQKTALMTGFKSGRELQSGPRGADAVGDVPIQIIPSEMTVRTIGCPLISHAQKFFVDMNTGTTIDNTYTVQNLTHSFSPGKYETTMKMTPTDAYAQVTTGDSVFKTVQNALEALKAPRSASGTTS